MIPIISESAGPIFIKFSGSVELWVEMINLTYVCNCSKDVDAYAKPLLHWLRTTYAYTYGKHFWEFGGTGPVCPPPLAAPLIVTNLSMQCREGLRWGLPRVLALLEQTCLLSHVSVCLFRKCIVAKRLIRSGCRFGWWVGSVEGGV